MSRSAWSAPLRAVAVATVVALALPLAATTARADEPATVGDTGVEPAAVEGPSVALASPTYTGYLASTVRISGTASLDAGAIRLARLDGETWVPLAVAVDRVDGAFTADVPITTARVQLRAELVTDGVVVTASAPAVVTGTRAGSSLTLRMTSRATDLKPVAVVASWTTADGRRPSASVQLLFKPRGSTSYRPYRTVRVVDGAARITIVPRSDGRFALKYPGGSTLTTATSTSLSFDNLPPGRVITLPRGAARPRTTLPAQPRASRLRADATVSTIPDAMWRSMKGRSWHAGCPVGRSSLRVVRVSYWAFDGYVRRGEIVMGKQHAAATARLFTTLFDQRTPIRSMYSIDRFGWSKKLKGADDYASMRADNTSGFNCRQVVGNPGRRSPHAYGKSVDINPWENPYASPQGYYPNASWQRRSAPTAVTWRGRTDPVVKAFRAQGFRWLGGFDLHHFER